MKDFDRSEKRKQHKVKQRPDTEAAEHVGTAQCVAVIDQKVALRTVQVLTLEEQTESRKEDSV